MSVVGMGEGAGAGWCRTCLAANSASLAPIFSRSELHARYSAALFLATGLQIQMNDGLPQTICWACTALVNSALLLRNQSHRAERRLLSLGFRRGSIFDTNNAKSKKKVLKNKTKILNSKNKSERLTKSNDSEPVVRKDSEDDWLSLSRTDLKCELNVKVELNKDYPLTSPTSNGDEQRSDCGKERLEEICKRGYSADENNLSPGDASDQDRVVEFAVRQKTAKRKSSINKQTYTLKQKRNLLMDLVDGPFDPKGPVRCKVCKKSVGQWSSFRTHAKLHLGFDFVCEYCGKSFVSITQLRRHKSAKHGEERTLVCARCPYKALDNRQLILHERRQHTGERPFVCDSCGASYFSRRCLIQHIENHNTARTIQCDKCPSLFKSRRHLARHTYTIHSSKAFNYKCHLCLKIYKKLKYVRKHMHKIHLLPTRDQNGHITKIRL